MKVGYCEKCPTCGTYCGVTWSGLDLVKNTGDETLASKCYTPVRNEEAENFKRYQTELWQIIRMHERTVRVHIEFSPSFGTEFYRVKVIYYQTPSIEGISIYSGQGRTLWKRYRDAVTALTNFFAEKLYTYDDSFCEQEYRYNNRTCSDCGGEFWDGGTSCICTSEDLDDEEILDDTCPNCGHEYDEIDYEYQICHICKHKNYDDDYTERTEHFECLTCGHKQNSAPTCEKCGSQSIEPLF